MDRPDMWEAQAPKYEKQTPATKPTPGPWAVDPELADFDYGAPQRDGTRLQLSRYVHAPKGGGGRIAQCFANCLVTTTGELEANARLIAAAPDLLEAAQRYMDTCPADEDTTLAFQDATNALRAAIRRATGEQS